MKKALLKGETMKKALFALLLISVLVLASCTPGGDAGIPPNDADAGFPPDTNEGETKEQKEIKVSWREIPLKDVSTGENFRVNDFTGKNILVESFAVWCPLCTKQQKEIHALKEELKDDLVSISLDTDPNEDEQKVLEHIKRNSFSGLYAVAPVEATRSLIDEFGVGVVNAPSAPVILICSSGETYKLKPGVKSAEDLKNSIDSLCA